MKAKSLFIILAVVLASCTPGATIAPTETISQVKPAETLTSEITQDRAIEAAQKSCGGFRAIQLEEPYEIQAVLMSYDEGSVDPSTEVTGNPVWYVILKGKWQGSGFPSGGLTPTPSITPTIWYICKVLVDAQSGETFSKSYNWDTASP
jgi:hypothetical protein